MPDRDIPLPSQSPDEVKRGKAMALLAKVLGEGQPLLGPSLYPTEVVTKNVPRRYNPAQLVDDPHGELAVQLLRARYPQLFKGVSAVQIGDATLPDHILGLTSGQRLRLGPSKNLADALATLRHELSHIAGLDDYGKLDAYDVSAASMQLNNDIRLPLPKDR